MPIFQDKQSRKESRFVDGMRQSRTPKSEREVRPQADRQDRALKTVSCVRIRGREENAHTVSADCCAGCPKIRTFQATDCRDVRAKWSQRRLAEDNADFYAVKEELLSRQGIAEIPKSIELVDIRIFS